MIASRRFLLAVWCGGLFPTATALASNPLITDQFTADPTARVFNGKIYLYPSHDILSVPGKGRPGWFCMEDYHVFSSSNLTDWTDHGVIVSQTSVEWVKPASYSMWAPDCVCKNVKYYFYFPALAKEGGGFRIGVAVSDRPDGAFKAEAKPLEGVRGIDPGVFIDRDGSAYLFYSAKNLFVAKLKDNMLELDGPPTALAHLPEKGLKEGPFVFERNGIYYLTYPHVQNRTERIEYAIARSPLGPFTPAGVIMDESPTGCWTNHQSIVEFNGEWLLFYHDKDLSPDFDKARSARADRLFFNEDGTIRKVIPTLRGVGDVAATGEIQIDRYSAISPAGVTVSFIDPANPSAGWKISLAAKTAWTRFDNVDFGAGRLKSIKARSISTEGGAVEIRLDKMDGPVVGRFTINPGSIWKVISATATKIPAGVHDLIAVNAGDSAVELDWISFE